jgi:hypothetical protein
LKSSICHFTVRWWNCWRLQLAHGLCWRRANSVSWRTWKWTKKCFFHLLDLTILSSYISLTSCGRK